MVAVSPAANSASRFLRAAFLTLVFIIACCDAFRPPSLKGMVSKSTIPTAKTSVPRSTFLRLIPTGKRKAILPKAIMVDQEERDESLPKLTTEIHKNIHIDQRKLPTNIDIGRLETWYLDRLEDSYAYTERYIKCPFFRRRYGDILDDVEGFVRFALVRPYFQDSTARLGPRISCKSIGKGTKEKHLSVEKLLQILRKDWRSPSSKNGTTDATTINEKGYYVTGRMSTNIYRDDCYFSSPDPDLPLKGLRKYIGVASHLFDSRASNSKLLSLKEIPGAKYQHPSRIIEAEWKMALTINLPWKPKLSEFTGSTLYFLDEENLICKHQETWDISVLDAFWSMLPRFKELQHAHNNHKKTMKSKASRCPFAAFASMISNPHQQDSSTHSFSSTASGKSEKQELDTSIKCTKSVDTTTIGEEELCIGG